MTSGGSRFFTPANYQRYLIAIAGLGGLLYGIDVGIISAALLYLGKTISLSLAQTSIIVAAVFGGGAAASLAAGFLADWLGRKKMMVISASMFVASIVLIVLSHGFLTLFLGRLLQGLSGGVIGVVVPLYLAECLSADMRGKGSGMFQLLLTVGIVIAAFSGFYYTRHAEAAIALAAGNADLIRAAQEHAWRSMFFSVIYPGVLFLAGSLFLRETPRWLFRHRGPEAALQALREISPLEEEAQQQLRDMQQLQADNETKEDAGGSLLRRRYVVPFVLACIVLFCNQATGINSVLGYLSLILRQAGMNASHATGADLLVKLLNVVMTVIGVALVDRKGRKFLLVWGTAGIMVALVGGSLIFRSLEAKHVDATAEVQALVRGNSLTVPADFLSRRGSPAEARSLTVLYSYNDGEKLVNAVDDGHGTALTLQPETAGSAAPLTIRRAWYEPVAQERTGWLMSACLGLYIAAFAIGPGVVVWLALSELMPTRIRSGGMGIALLLNVGASTLIAGVFLPTVGNYGYSTMFLFWTACTALYFVTARFFLPETKGKTLEEIERMFDRGVVSR